MYTLSRQTHPVAPWARQNALTLFSFDIHILPRCEISLAIKIRTHTGTLDYYNHFPPLEVKTKNAEWAGRLPTTAGRRINLTFWRAPSLFPTSLLLYLHHIAENNPD
jgi:hypothetical protein